MNKIRMLFIKKNIPMRMLLLFIHLDDEEMRDDEERWRKEEEKDKKGGKE